MHLLNFNTGDDQTQFYVGKVNYRYPVWLQRVPVTDAFAELKRDLLEHGGHYRGVSHFVKRVFPINRR